MDQMNVKLSIKKVVSEKLYYKELEKYFFINKDSSNLKESDFLQDSIYFELFINKSKVRGFVDYSKILISLIDNRYIEEINIGIYDNRRTNIYIVNSSCLIPSDIGIEEGIFVNSNDDIVTWNIRDKETINILGKDSFVFDRKKYDEIIEVIFKFINNNASPDVLCSHVSNDTNVLEIINDIKINYPECYKEIY